MVANETEIVNLALIHLGNQKITSIDGTDTIAVLAEEVYDENRDYVLGLREWGCTIKRAHLVKASESSISGATAATPPVITCSGHPFADGQLVSLSGVVGMTELNTGIFLVDDSATDTFELQDMYGVDIVGSGYTAYTSGGTVFLSPGTEWDYAYDLPSDCIRPIEILDENWQSAGVFTGDHYAYVQEGRVLYTNVEYASLKYIKKETDPTKYDSQLVEMMALRLAWILSNKITGITQSVRQDLEKQVQRLRIQAGLIDARAKRNREPREKAWR